MRITASRKLLIPALLFLFTGVMLFSSCRLICNTQDLGNMDLPADHRALVPYTAGQSVNFADTSGSVHSFEVVSRDLDYEEGDHCKCGCCKYNYLVQADVTHLTCASSGLEIYLNMILDYYPDVPSQTDFTCEMSGAGLQHGGWGMEVEGKTGGPYYNSYQEFYDSLDIGGTVYRDVYFFDNDYYTPLDSGLVTPVHLYYNTTYGVLRIELAGGQAYSIL